MVLKAWLKLIISNFTACFLNSLSGNDVHLLCEGHKNLQNLPMVGTFSK